MVQKSNPKWRNCEHIKYGKTITAYNKMLVPDLTLRVILWVSNKKQDICLAKSQLRETRKNNIVCIYLLPSN